MGTKNPTQLKKPAKTLTTPCLTEVKYSFDDGLRRVAPYFYTYNTHVKERWRGKELLDVFAAEFRDRLPEFYRRQIVDGQIVVNGKQVAPEYKLRNGDLIANSLHRHEPPVTADPIGIVSETDDMIVINKPAGVPVHPAGRYQFNTVVQIMKADMGLNYEPLPCNRLDRLTSGVMFMAKNAPAANKICAQIKDRTVQKEYVARVKGNFPDGDITCEQPILSISPKYGLNMVRAHGKEAKTVFRRIAYYPPKQVVEADALKVTSALAHTGLNDEEAKFVSAFRNEGYSIVQCLPLTGRTHQIRVHLQFLGYPITNDPIYANQRVWGQNLGKGGGDRDEDIITHLSRMGKDEVADAVAYHDEMVEQYHTRRAEKLSGATCSTCQTALYTDPGVHELGLYLHAKRYECDNGSWSFETPLPMWALPPKLVELL